MPGHVCRQRRIRAGQDSRVPSAKGSHAGVSLEVLAAAAAQSLPQQQKQLVLLRRVSAATSSQLASQAARPHTYAGDLALTPQQRNIKGLALVSLSAWGCVVCMCDWGHHREYMLATQA